MFVWLKLLTPGGGVKLAKNTKSWKGPVMGRRDRPVVSLLTGEKTLCEILKANISTLKNL